ncbi:patatin-like phospholipase family protein [bacterium]|nr:patatin-like phospholipase family protein [bacterium]MBU1983654.1 patatin-like phospholipase family protein [bacterium]
MYYFRRLLIAVLVVSSAYSARAETVALALSGGGARGFAHIGVIQALEEEGLEPDLIVGTSMGAVVGGLWAAGYNAAELKSLAMTTDWSGLFLDRPARRNLFLAKKETRSRHILMLRFRGWMPEVPVALSSGQQVSELLFDFVQRAPYHAWRSFDDLRIPFRVVATDLISGEPVVFAKGDLAEAMRASVSLPLILVPYELDTLLLADGGVIENIPVEIARANGADAVVAVDLSSGIETASDVELPWELADRVTTLMHAERNETSRRMADVVLTPDVGAHKASDFDHIEMLIEAGYAAARENMSRLRSVLRKADDDSAQSTTFCSRRLYGDFCRSVQPERMPPKLCRFSGISMGADSLAAGSAHDADGLSRLAALRRGYLHRGRTLAHVTQLELDSAGTLHSQWEEGRIRSIRVTGLRRYRERTVLNEFLLIPDQVFDLRRARRSITQIYGSDLFSSVNLSVLPTDSGAHLKLRVRERESPQLRFGAGYSLERKGRGFAEFLNDNLLAINARLALFGKYGERDEEVSARLTFDRLPVTVALDRLLQSYTTTDLRVSWTREEFDFYDAQHHDTSLYVFERTRASLWLGRGFRRWGELAAGLRYEGVSAGGVLDEPTAHITYLGIRALIDTKDDYPFPTSGFSWNGRYEYALKSRQTGRSFNRLLGSADGYLPLAPRVVAHAQGNWAWNDFLLPLWAQFPLGGENSLLGLHGAERYGSGRLTALGELRYDLLSRWVADAYLSALYTVGAVSPESDPLPKSSDYLHGVGGRFALSTFLGPMTFTVGELLKSHFGTGHTMIYLNLGHEF